MSDIPDENTPDSKDDIRFEDLFEEEPLTGEDLLGLGQQTLLYEISVLRRELEDRLDRVKYYHELLSRDDLEVWIATIKKIEREFS